MIFLFLSCPVLSCPVPVTVLCTKQAHPAPLLQISHFVFFFCFFSSFVSAERGSLAITHGSTRLHVISNQFVPSPSRQAVGCQPAADTSTPSGDNQARWTAPQCRTGTQSLDNIPKSVSPFRRSLMRHVESNVMHSVASQLISSDYQLSEISICLGQKYVSLAQPRRINTPNITKASTPSRKK